MLIFIDEEAGYLAWLRRHREGFVLDGRRKPRLGRLMLHRALCPELKGTGRRTHWTTGPHFKACALEIQPLFEWAMAETGRSPAACLDCHPLAEVPEHRESLASQRLTRLGENIVNYVLEVAVICLGRENGPYRLTVEEIAECLSKSTGQIASPLGRLVQQGYLTVEPTRSNGQRLSLAGRARVYPTPQALRTLPAFAAQSEEELRGEIGKLRGLAARVNGSFLRANSQ
jgi:hypothetical protein